MLSQNDLKAGFVSLFDYNDKSFVGFPPDIAHAADNFASVYDAYAQKAVNDGGNSVILANKALFKSVFLANVATSLTATACAAAFGAAFVAYWTGATFGFDKPPPKGEGGDETFSKALASVVSAVTPADLQVALSAEMTALSTDAQAKAAAFAAIFHAATTTSVVTLTTGLDTTPPPAGPLPIQSLATIS